MCVCWFVLEAVVGEGGGRAGGGGGRCTHVLCLSSGNRKMCVFFNLWRVQKEEKRFVGFFAMFEREREIEGLFSFLV